MPPLQVHYGHCLIGVALAVVLLVALGVQASTLGVLAVALVCPLMMFVMMKMVMRDQSVATHHDDDPVDQSDTVEGWGVGREAEEAFASTRGQTLRRCLRG